MANLTKDFFYSLSKNKFLNKGAKKWGLKLGASKFVAGTDFESAKGAIKELNTRGISVTVDHLGEFVTEQSEANEAKETIIRSLQRMKEENLDCHLSVKLTQLGLDIDPKFCLKNMKEILAVAEKNNIFVNIDMEDYSRYEKTLEVFRELYKEYKNLGTVIQACLHRAEKDLDELKDVRIRIVKGAYKESPEVAFPSKKDIDDHFVKLAKKRLLSNTFTSIATHDHNIINELKSFIMENNINRDLFEFQMLYGFRKELQYALAEEGYRFCTYIPIGNDWFGYYMRRIAERPQNINLVVKDVFYNSENKFKKQPIITGALAVLLLYILKKYKKDCNCKEVS